MNRKMKKDIILYWAVVIGVMSATALTGCSGEKFHVAGTIANAKDSMLYFEHNGLDGFAKIDSAKLDGKGNFSFSGNKVDNPEFYRLRIAGQIINVAIDSTETVNVKATYPQMATNYTVSSSYENQKIKELALKQITLQSQCQAIAAQQPDVADSLINIMVSEYKQDVTRNYIFKEPMKAYSYFALFQYIVVGNQAQLIFDPTRDAADNKVFGAVATSWDTFFPGSERGQNLHNITLKGMKDERIVKAQKKEVELNAQVSGVIDLPLRDNLGRERHLTALKGKVVLLDFHVFSAPGSPEYIMQLRELYNKYHAQGLEIFMVSLDYNAHFWKEQVASLPWINVYDDTGISQAYTAPATTTPIIYLIDRNNDVVRNPAQIKNIEQEIKTLL